MDEKRTYLKELAARFARTWSKAPLPAAFAGETRIETRNTIYQLVDGVCCGVRRHQSGDSRRAPPSAYVGMRIIGWLRREDPQGGITQAWAPGAYAVLWRPRATGEEHSAIALTSTSQAFAPVRSKPVALAAAARPARASTPPPLPPARGAILPRPPTPPSWVPPAPPSMTRVHHGHMPPPPETRTPVRRTGTPPPLPARALASRSAVQRVSLHALVAGRDSRSSVLAS